jgi:hypothetical protein
MIQIEPGTGTTDKKEIKTGTTTATTTWAVEGAEVGAGAKVWGRVRDRVWVWV